MTIFMRRQKTYLVGLFIFVSLLFFEASRLHKSTASSLEISNQPSSNSTWQDFIVPTKFTHAALNSSKLALLIETRAVSHLSPLLLHFLEVVPQDWTFLVLGSSISLNHLDKSHVLRPFRQNGKLRMELLSEKYLYHSAETISQTLTSKSFYDEYILPAEHLLVFQPDSILCSNSERSVDDFLEYDYVGAPWPNCEFGGNGGLSLRRVSKTLKVLEVSPRPNNHLDLEDNWISQKMKDLPNSNVAPSSVERTFSVEMIYEQAPLGFHLGGDARTSTLYPDIWQNAQRRKEIYAYCPEIKIILDMELVGRAGLLWKLVDRISNFFGRN